MKYILSLMLLLLTLSARAETLPEQLGLSLLPTDQGKDRPMAIFLTGDGGWAVLDKGVSGHLQENGIPVIGWSSQSYYWQPKTPDEVAQDLVTIVKQYSTEWHRKKWMMIGYSFGAEVIPFIINRLPKEMRHQLVAAVLLSATTSSDFEIHLSDMIKDDSQGKYLTVPETRKIHDVPFYCLHGKDDVPTAGYCSAIADMKNVTVLPQPGGHHFDDDYPRIAKLIMSLVGATELSH